MLVYTCQPAPEWAQHMVLSWAPLLHMQKMWAQRAAAAAEFCGCGFSALL